MNKHAKQMLTYHEKNLVRIQKREKTARTKEFRNKLIAEYKNNKEMAKQMIKEREQELKNLKEIASSDPIKKADQEIKELTISLGQDIEKTHIVIKALKDYKD